MRIALAAVVMIVLAGAGTATAARVEGALALLPTANVRGDLTIVAEEGGFDLSRVLLEAQPVNLTWKEARGFFVTDVRQYVGPTGTFVGGLPGQEGTTREDVQFGEGGFANLTCADSCKAFLFAWEGGPATLELRGRADGPWREVAQDTSYWVGWAEPGVEDAFYYGVPAGWHNFSATAAPDATALDGMSVAAHGRLGIILWNVTGERLSAAGSERFETGTRAEPTTGPGGVVTGSRSVNRFLVLEMADASLSLAPGAPVVAHVPSAQARFDGSLAAAAAHGELRVDGQRVEARGESVRIDGALDLALAFVPRSEIQGSPLATRALEAGIEGEASQVLVGDAVVARDSSRAAGIAAGAGLLALLALVWAYLKWGGIQLYTRIEAVTVLQNPNRRRIYDHLCASPGRSIAEIVRETGISQVVVRHHLRMLEVHAYVVQRGRGKLKVYFPNDGRLGQAAASGWIALKDDTRRAIAGCIARSSAPLSQKEIAEATGVSQRLVSYHLAKLEAEGLVRLEGSMPRRYVADPRLTVFVDDPAVAA